MHEQPEATDEEHTEAPQRLPEEDAKSGAGFEQPDDPSADVDEGDSE